MISYITSHKKTIVPSQSLDSVQQQHVCKDVCKFFILSKNRYINHKIITIIHKNQIIRNKKFPCRLSDNSAKSIIFVGDKSQYVQHHIL